MKTLFPLLFPRRFLSGVFMIFRVPGGDAQMVAGGTSGAGSGVQGIVHVSMLEEVIMWVLAHFSICRLCAAP